MTIAFNWCSIGGHDLTLSFNVSLMTHSTRASLLQRIKSTQDANAWFQFAELYTPLVHRWVKDLGFHDSESNDIVQEVFVALLGKLSSFRYDPQKTFRGWLRTVTINKCKDKARKGNRKSEPQFLDRIEKAAIDETSLLTEQEYRDYLSSAALKLMKKHFSQTTWQACWEHVANGKPAPQVAQDLGISTNAVYLARGRVLKRLREELDGLWED